MKIAIITNFIDDNAGGIATYAYNLIKELNKIDYKNTYYLIHSAYKDLDIYKNNKEIVIPQLSLPYRRTIWRYIQLPIYLAINHHKFDIIHDLYEIPTFTFIPIKSKKVVTVYDLSGQMLKYHTLLNYLLHKILFRRMLSRVDTIITISFFSKKEILKYYRINANLIHIVYPGVNKRFNNKKLKTDISNTIKDKYSLPVKYLLFIGTIEPRKNLTALIKAYNLLEKKYQIPLIIVGKKGWKYQVIYKLLEKYSLGKKVRILGFIDDKDLPHIYKLATLFLYPSLYEGFGLPPLEAMASGCPVITSNTTSLPEVVGNAGLMIDPNNINEIANAIRKVLAQYKFKCSIINKGLRQSKKFSWDKTAYQTLKIYNKL